MSNNCTHTISKNAIRRSVCARARIEVKTAVTASQARVYREIWRHKSGTHPSQTVPHPLQIGRLRRRDCGNGPRRAEVVGGV